MVFQGYTLFPWLTVKKNVMFGLEINGYGRVEAERQALQWLQLVGLEKFADSYPHQLSGGMKQRVAIVRALANQPRILLMDEPFGALDAQTRCRMQAHLLEIWRKIDITIVFITHDLDEAIFLADRILVLSAHPGEVQELIEVPVPRPRSTAQMHLAGVPRHQGAARRADPSGRSRTKTRRSTLSDRSAAHRRRRQRGIADEVAERTWDELPRDLAALRAAAILPVGATEQHGPHLGCGVDAVLADGSAPAVAERTNVPMLPTLPYGCSLGHSRRWPGTHRAAADHADRARQADRRLGLSQRRASAVHRQRACHQRRAVALRARDAARRARRPDGGAVQLRHAERARARGAFRRRRGLARQRRRDLADAGARARHGARRADRRGRRSRPHAAVCVFAHPVNRTSRNGVTGSPSRATADKGRLWFDWMVEDLSALIARGMRETPPLEHSYFEAQSG